MKSILARDPHERFSFSRRFFGRRFVPDEDEEEMGEMLGIGLEKYGSVGLRHSLSGRSPPLPGAKKKSTYSSIFGVSKLRSVLGRAKTHFSPGQGTKIVGTLFGHRRGHVQLAFQDDFKTAPCFLVELATPTSVLVKEMASGTVRIALECEKSQKKRIKLLKEPIWRAYCNGKRCGDAISRKCSAEDWKVLSAVGPISMGAGVLPVGAGDAAEEGEMMYMKAKFERVVGSKDSEAFYMMNPDGGNNGGGPELSIYLLRV